MRPAPPNSGQIQSATRAAPPPAAPPPPAPPPAAKSAPAGGSTEASAPRNIAPAPLEVAPAPTRSNEALAIEPIAAPDNDPSLTVEWHAVPLGAHRSLGCVARASAGNALTLLVEQGVYRKTLSGTDSLEITTLPCGAAGTEGRLTVRDETTGKSAQFTWVWQPPGTGAPAQRLKSSPETRAAGSKDTARQIKSEAARTAATAFFGQPAEGRRFAFILDMSLSMTGPRWAACLRELTTGLEALSGRGEFFLVLFSNTLAEPPNQIDWMLADPQVIAGALSWAAAVVPAGGTFPWPAFERVFTLSGRPDAIYFLTDGEFTDCTAADVARLNNNGGSKLGSFARAFFGRGNQAPAPAVINTIALDDSGAAAALRKIAQDSGGAYIHASSV
jgi:hypothetical protein